MTLFVMCEVTCSMVIGRYVLVTAGPVFTEEMWRLACCALQDAFSATLEPVKVTKQPSNTTEVQLLHNRPSGK